MLIVLVVTLVLLVAWLSAVLYQSAQDTQRHQATEDNLIHALDSVNLLTEEAEVRNQYLDYLFQTFYLHTANPYVILPTWEEPRCYHCHYPNYAGHEPSCAWLHCRPLTSVLYTPPPAPVSAPPDTDGDTVFPVEPDATDEPETSTDAI